MVEINYKDESHIPLAIVFVAVSAMLITGVCWNLYFGARLADGPARPSAPPAVRAPLPPGPVK